MRAQTIQPSGSTHQRVTLGRPERSNHRNFSIAPGSKMSHCGGGCRWFSLAASGSTLSAKASKFIHRTRRRDAQTGIFGKPKRRLVGDLAHSDQRAPCIAIALALRASPAAASRPTVVWATRNYHITPLIRRLHRDSNYNLIVLIGRHARGFSLADRTDLVSSITSAECFAEALHQEIGPDMKPGGQ